MWFDSLQSFQGYWTFPFSIRYKHSAKQAGKENWENCRLEDIALGECKRTTELTATRKSLKRFSETSSVCTRALFILVHLFAVSEKQLEVINFYVTPTRTVTIIVKIQFFD